jgi:anti-sigma factor ChrR (cupin superfamily)
MDTPDERLTLPGELPWIGLADGIDFRLLYTSRETGRWTVLLRCQPGSFFGTHKHYAAGEYFVVKGRMEYRMGAAEEGTYGYEPLGVIHDHTSFPVYTELLFTNYGPVAFLDDGGNIASILDNALLEDLAAAVH